MQPNPTTCCAPLSCNDCGAVAVSDTAIVEIPELGISGIGYGGGLANSFLYVVEGGDTNWSWMGDFACAGAHFGVSVVDPEYVCISVVSLVKIRIYSCSPLYVAYDLTCEGGGGLTVIVRGS